MNYQAFSGGAQGADLAWQTEAKKLGLSISFTHYRPEHAAGLSAENAAIVRKAIIEACKSMGRLWPTNSLAYVQRNYLIAKSCDILYAIGTLQPMGKEELIVRGGTGWGVTFANHLHKPVYLFNQLDNQWYSLLTDTWLLEECPVLCMKPALIGSRQLSKAGLAAIQQVLTQTKERNAYYQTLNTLP